MTYFAIALALGVLTGCIAFAGAQAVLWWTDRAARRRWREVMRHHNAETRPAQDKYDRDRATFRLAQHYGATMKRPEGFTNIDGTGA